MESRDLPKRKHPRLKRYDYSTNARYFVTVCTFEKQKVLSSIKSGRGAASAPAPAEIYLSEAGKIIEEELLLLPLRYRDLIIENYVIMPNHIHAILTLNAPLTVGTDNCSSHRSALTDIICTFKSLCARRCKNSHMVEKLWQTSFYEHIIRNEYDYKNVWTYIDNNPSKWAEDKYYCD